MATVNNADNKLAYYLKYVKNSLYYISRCENVITFRVGRCYYILRKSYYISRIYYILRKWYYISRRLLHLASVLHLAA